MVRIDVKTDINTTNIAKNELKQAIKRKKEAIIYLEESMIEALGLESISQDIKNILHLDRTTKRFWITLSELDKWLEHYPAQIPVLKREFLLGKMIYPEQEIVKAKEAEKKINSTSSRIDYLQKEIMNIGINNKR